MLRTRPHSPVDKDGGHQNVNIEMVYTVCGLVNALTWLSANHVLSVYPVAFHTGTSNQEPIDASLFSFLSRFWINFSFLFFF